MPRKRNRYGRKPTCSKCGSIKENPKSGYCNSCKNSLQRKLRPKHLELPEEQRKKANCRSYLHVYIKRGKIKKGVCFCGSTDVEAHHADYDKPLEVTWLCRKHHLTNHDNINREPYVYDKNDKYDQ